MGKAFRSFRSRLIRHIVDILMLKYTKENGHLAGYDFINWMIEDYGILLSAGTIYAKLYALERKGLIKGELIEKRRQFTLTRQGKAMIEDILAEPTTEKLFALLLEKR